MLRSVGGITWAPVISYPVQCSLYLTYDKNSQHIPCVCDITDTPCPLMCCPASSEGSGHSDSSPPSQNALWPMTPPHLRGPTSRCVMLCFWQALLVAWFDSPALSSSQISDKEWAFWCLPPLLNGRSACFSVYGKEGTV